MPRQTQNQGKALPSLIPLPEALSASSKNFDKRLAARPAALYRPIPLGIDTLDRAFSGGIHPTDLTIIAGRQNVGKTIFITQIASNIAKWATQNKLPIVPWVCCYEHDEWSLFTRLLCMESWKQCPESPITYKMIINTLTEVKEKHPDSKDVFSLLIKYLPKSAAAAMGAISTYFDNLSFYYGQRTALSVEYIEAIIREYENENGKVLIPIIDYLQTIPPNIEMIQHSFDPMAGDLIIKRNLNRLKDMCVRQQIPALVVAAIRTEALSRSGPVHTEDIAGPEETAYAVDSSIILNYDTITGGSISQAEGREASIRISIEKNRRGPVPLEWRHSFKGGSFYIDPEGETVSPEESYQNSRVNMEQKTTDNT